MTVINLARRSGPARTALGFGLAALVLLVVAPALLSAFRLELLGKYVCLAMVGVGIGLAWGRGGMLTLGQGVFFGLGGYIMAMYLTMAQTDPGQLPDFMIGAREEYPAIWLVFQSPFVAVPAVVVVPVFVAFLLGSMIFRRRVRGPYFAILSQALAAAMAILLVGQAKITGGTNGLNGITSFFGYDRNDPVNKQMIFTIAGVLLLLLIALSRQLSQSRYGEVLVAVRDSEERVRFLGYDPAAVKIIAYCVAAGMAGIAGAMFVCVVGFITPLEVGIVFSIEFVIGVAVGGRATILGPAIGVIAVAWAKSTLSTQFPSEWSYLQGALFIVVVAFLPGGLASIFLIARDRLPGRASTSPTDEVNAPDPARDSSGPTPAEVTA